MRRPLRPLAGLLLALLPAPALAEGITVRDAYAVSPYPGAPTGAAYLVIDNPGPADRLLSASSPAAAHVLLHASVEAEGVLRMEEAAEGLELPAAGELALAPGGAHVMLMGLAEPLEDGATLPLVLTFEAAGEVAVEVPVDFSRRPGARGGHAGH